VLAPRGLWCRVILLAVAEMVSWGVLFYSFGVLLLAMEADLGVGRATLTGVFSAALLVAGLSAASVGRWLDRWGARRIMTVGAIVASLLVALWSRVESLAAFAAVWLAIGFAQAMVLYEPAFAAVTSWFTDTKLRARALLTIALVAGLASTIFLPLTGMLLASHGWRTTVALLGLAVAVVTIPVHFFLPSSRHRAVEHVKPVSGGPGYPRAGFGWLIAAFSLQAAIYGTLVVHAVPLLIEAGHAPVRAATMAGAFGIFQVVGRLLMLAWWERVPVAWRVGGLIGGQVIAVLALFVASHEAAVWIFAVSFGASNGLLTLARPLAVAEWQGTMGFGAASGRLATWAQSVRAIAPLLASMLHGASGGYVAVSGALVIVGIAGIISARRAEGCRRRPPEYFDVSV
jgi:hypothetical protein